jgi:hypothetical protein
MKSFNKLFMEQLQLESTPQDKKSQQACMHACWLVGLRFNGVAGLKV